MPHLHTPQFCHEDTAINVTVNAKTYAVKQVGDVHSEDVVKRHGHKEKRPLSAHS
jgi:hypothetical protein